MTLSDAVVLSLILARVKKMYHDGLNSAEMSEKVYKELKHIGVNATFSEIKRETENALLQLMRRR
jgi:hypothetical protein